MRTALNRQDEPRYDMDDLLRVMQRLRDPEHGCPWDIQQDFSTIVPSTLEEAYELVLRPSSTRIFPTLPRNSAT